MERKEKLELTSQICNRAIALGIITMEQKLSSMMDIERADASFTLDLEGLLYADEENFVHDFCGIAENVNRRTLNKGEVLTLEDWHYFVPRYAK